MEPDKEKTLLGELKSRVRDSRLNDSSDEYLLKWLSAGNYNIGQAEKLIRQNIEWRRTNKVDELLDSYVVQELFVKYFSCSFIGTDKFGSPIWYSAMGRIDVKGFLLSAPKDECSRFIVWLFENMMHQIRLANERKTACGTTITTQTFLLDLEGLDKKIIASKPALDLIIEQLRTVESYYPDCFRRIFIINASKIFSVAYNMMRTVLSKNTLEKMMIFDKDKSKWIPALLEEIDPEILSVHYGGKVVGLDGDPRWPSRFHPGGDIPKHYYMRNNKPVPRESMESLIVSGGSKRKLKFKVHTINSILRWEFMTEGGGICFHVYCKNPRDEVIELFPFIRCESHLLMEEGQIICDLIGTYVLEFDNSSKIFKPKKLHYEVAVDPPVTS